MMKRSFALKHNHRYLEMHFQKEKKKEGKSREWTVGSPITLRLRELPC
jgi:hypothetical protein